MTTASSGAQGSLVLDAEALYRELLRGVRSLRAAHAPGGHCLGRRLAGERLQQDLGLEGAPGVLSSAMHRDDFAQRGLASSAQTALPFDVNGADILVLDDVLYTGRTVRAVLNELFDYGRPARAPGRAGGPRRARAARAGRLCRRARGAARSQSLALARNDGGSFLPGQEA
jgi:pyrimidine operon attenuation protein/uracil phosphoribosyltransferase